MILTTTSCSSASLWPSSQSQNPSGSVSYAPVSRSPSPRRKALYTRSQFSLGDHSALAPNPSKSSCVLSYHSRLRTNAITSGSSLE